MHINFQQRTVFIILYYNWLKFSNVSFYEKWPAKVRVILLAGIAVAKSFERYFLCRIDFLFTISFASARGTKALQLRDFTRAKDWGGPQRLAEKKKQNGRHAMAQVSLCFLLMGYNHGALYAWHWVVRKLKNFLFDSVDNFCLIFTLQFLCVRNSTDAIELDRSTINTLFCYNEQCIFIVYVYIVEGKNLPRYRWRFKTVQQCNSKMFLSILHWC